MLTILSFSIAALAAPAAGTDVLATYRGGTVTRAEYESWLLGQGLEDAPAMRAGTLEALALSESLVAAAVAAGLDRQPQNAFRLAQIEIGLLAAALRQETDRAIAITDEQVEAVLKEEEKERYRPRTVLLKNIFKRVPADAPPARRAAIRSRMEEIRRELLAGGSFDELAARESDSQTRFRGGAMGYVPPGVLSPDVDRLVAGLGKGDLSAVLESADGFTLLRCDDISEARVIPLDEARTIIRQGLWSRTSRTRQADLRADLLKSAAPRYAETPGPDDAAAVDFRGGRVTEAELRWLSDGPPAATPEARRGLLEEQVVRMAAAALARERGLDRDPLLRARAEVQRARLLATAEVARRIDQTKLRPTEAEKRARFERDRDRYKSLPEVDVSVIGWPAAGTAELRRRYAEAESLLGRVHAGEVTFEDAARQVSVLPSAPAGGRLGFLQPEQLASFGPNLFRTVEALSPGETSRLVQQDQQLFAVKLWARKPARPLTFEEVAVRIEQELGDARVAEVQKAVQEAALRELAFALAEAPGKP